MRKCHHLPRQCRGSSALIVIRRPSLFAAHHSVESVQHPARRFSPPSSISGHNPNFSMINLVQRPSSLNQRWGFKCPSIAPVTINCHPPVIGSTWALINLCSLSIATHHPSQICPFSLIVSYISHSAPFTPPNTSVCLQTAYPMESKFAILLDGNIPSAVSSLSLTNHHLNYRRKGKHDTHSLHVCESSVHLRLRIILWFYSIKLCKPGGAYPWQHGCW